MCMVGVRDQAGLLCDQLARWPELAGTIRKAGAGAELDGLLAALAGQEEPDPREMAAWLAAIEGACASLGLAGVTNREYAFRPLPRGFSGGAEDLGWVCPRDRCDRVVLPEEAEAGTVPTCAAAGGTPMTAFTAPSS
jgi:hypothetical protein